MHWWRWHKIQLQNIKQKVNSLKGFLLMLLVGISLTACFAGKGNESATSIPIETTPTATAVVAKQKDVELTLVSFAVTRNAYKSIIPQFVEKWKQEHNQDVKINQSYGGSGAQTRAVVDGLPGDVVHLALALDTKRLEKSKLIQPGWEEEFPNNGIVSKSVVALVTREGNPKGLKSLTDLAKDGVRLITADPKTSGVARWNFLALWNAGLKAYGSEEKALELVTKAYNNAPILTRDAREATDSFFKQSQGDALINYENEIILAEQKGRKVSYVIPDVNISIDNPIAIVDKNVDRHGNRQVVEAFVKYLFTKEAQTEFAKVGFRPVDETVAQTKEVTEKYPKVNNLATVKEFGGWDKVQKKFFADNAIFDQIQAKISR
ncbi:MAG: sulfate ABC transporter substrate-binding protein [Scytonematopsis contorta HA4267-MV1]|jgi:sulfate transport system substrate-binding protein|nr:sulfate ABC transporter substrate-binding protein [Scytonematopsis contorta HA4267-MV1]